MSSTVLVTGAAGFVGRYVVGGLIGIASGDKSNSGANYDRIIAMDIVSAEKIAEVFYFSPRVCPLQWDLESLVDADEPSVRCFKQTLRSVSSIIHIAGIVDTRETNEAVRKLNRVNMQATEALVDLAAECGVKSFVFVSSASACIESRSADFSIRTLVAALGLDRSLVSGMKMSTYGSTKLAAERIVLGKGAVSQRMRVAVVRPHVVWGRGDSLSTEVIISWDPRLPEFTIGDPSTMVASGRVDIIAAYIVMTDLLLNQDSGAEHSGLVFNISDSLSTINNIHLRIADCRNTKNLLCSDVLNGADGLGCCMGAAANSLNKGACKVFVLNIYITIIIIAAVEWMQYLLKISGVWIPPALSRICRLLTMNNFAYASKELLLFPTLASYETDCEVLYFKSHELQRLPGDVSAQLFQSWKASWPCDHVVLSKDWLRWIICRSAPPDVMFTTPSEDTMLATHCSIGPLKMYNRVIKAATFECMAGRDGVPTDELARFHARNATGGVGMTVVAYASVSSDGRSFPTQICINSGDDSIDRRTEHALMKLCEDVHTARDGALVALQLTHAGAFADATYNGNRPARGPSAILNPLTLKYSLSLDNDHESLERIQNDFVVAVDYCRRVGFDAIELHLGHGYLLSQFLSAATNPKYGDNAKKRLEFPLQVLTAVCAEAHARSKKYIAVLVKFNVSELTEKDLSLSDARLFARFFIDAGADLLVPSGGHVMVNGLHMLRGGRPLMEMAAAQQQLLKRWVIAFAGKYFVKKEEFREAFFRERVMSVMLGAGVPLSKVCLVGGVHEFKTADCAVRYDGFLCVQLGRVLLADPDWCIKVGAFRTNSDCDQQQITDDNAVESCHVAIEKKCSEFPVSAASHLRAISRKPLNICDNSNKCIVGATMALEPLRCSKHGQVPDW